MKHLLLTATALLLTLTVNAQEKYGTDNALFNHLDLSLSLGTTGIGFDVAAPVGEYVKVRAGGTFMPHFHKTMTFTGFQVGTYKPNSKMTEQETYDYRINHLNELMENMMGFGVESSVKMIGQPDQMNNFKFLVDVFPLRDKHWHATVGFYLGGSRIAKAANSYADAQTMLAIRSYNTMYYKALADEPMIQYGDIWVYNYDVSKRFLAYGKISMPMGTFSHDIIATEDIYYDHSEVDPETGYYLTETITDVNGNTREQEICDRDADGNKVQNVRYHKGDIMYHEGDTYHMTPDESNQVSAEARVKKFKPYVGIGYEGYLSRKTNTMVAVDAGVLFWGGTPKVVTHDGIDLINDLSTVHSSLKSYVNLCKTFPVYPVVELRLTQRIF